MNAYAESEKGDEDEGKTERKVREIAISRVILLPHIIVCYIHVILRSLEVISSF